MNKLLVVHFDSDSADTKWASTVFVASTKHEHCMFWPPCGLVTNRDWATYIPRPVGWEKARKVMCNLKFWVLNWFLVGGLEHVLFLQKLGIIIPTDFHIFQRGSSHQPGFGHIFPLGYWIETRSAVSLFSGKQSRRLAEEYPGGDVRNLIPRGYTKCGKIPGKDITR